MSAEELRKKIARSRRADAKLPFRDQILRIQDALDIGGNNTGVNAIANTLGPIRSYAESDKQAEQKDALYMARYTDITKLRKDANDLAESLRSALSPSDWASYFDPNFTGTSLTKRFEKEKH